MPAKRNRTIKAAAGVFGLLIGTLAFAPGASVAAPAIPGSQAGAIEIWGTVSGTDSTPVRTSHPAADGPWAAVAIGNGSSTYAITTAGSLELLTGGLAVPTNLESAKIKAVSTFGSKAAAVLEDGSVQVWGQDRGVPAKTFSTETLGGKAVDVAVGTTLITIQLEGGKVGMAFSTDYEIVPSEAGGDLTGVVEISGDAANGFARLSGGGLVGFNTSGALTNFPVSVRGENVTDKVVSFEARGGRIVAATQTGAVHYFNYSTGAALPAYPTEAADGKVVRVATTNLYAAALTNDKEVVVWGQSASANGYAATTIVPEEVEGQRVTKLVGGLSKFAAIVGAPLVDVTETAKPTIAGTAKVGSTLTGTPATFAGPPDSITNRWFANGVPIEGAVGAASTYTLTAAEVGKTITFRSTATRVEDAVSLESTSTPVGPVAAPDPPPAIASTTAVAAPASTYGAAGTATVTVGNAGGRPVAGTVTLSGAGAAQTAAVVGGKATFALDKALAAGSYTLTAAYSGSASVLNASAGTATYTVAKAKSKKPTFKANKAPTSKKKGKATVTIGSSSGLAKATGKATVTLKNGRTTKKIKVTLSGGKKSISLPKLKKGTWKVQVSYNGDKNYVAQKSKSTKLKIKK